MKPSLTPILILNPTSIIRSAALMGVMTLMSAPAFAGDSAFQAASASDAKIRVGATAFKKGDFKKAAVFNQAALDGRLSPKKKAIAQSNLCAAYAELGQMGAAKTACDTALALRPSFAPAQHNAKALSVKLAAMDTQSASQGAE